MASEAVMVFFLVVKQRATEDRAMILLKPANRQTVNNSGWSRYWLLYTASLA